MHFEPASLRARQGCTLLTSSVWILCRPDLEIVGQLRDAIVDEVRRAESLLASHQMVALVSLPRQECIDYHLLKGKVRSEILKGAM